MTHRKKQEGTIYLEAGRSLGTKPSVIVIRHLLLNIMGSLVAQASLFVGTFLIVMSSLTFLGLGIQPPTPTRGSMIREGIVTIQLAPWIAVFPGLAITFSVIAFNLLGEGLRDQLDPTTRQK